MILILAFIFGATIGSFLNCVIYRLETNEGFVTGRSHCTRCGETIRARDLVPIFSFIFLKGRCRYCRAVISFQYPLVEIATGLAFISILIFQRNEGIFAVAETVFFLLIFCLMIIMFVYDLRHYLIPDEAVFTAIGATFLWYGGLFIVGITSFPVVIGYFLSGMGAAGFFLAIFLISKGVWMGFGDVKLALFMGLFLGFPEILVALFSSFMSGAIIGLVMVFLKKKKIKSEIPFAPFLILGTVLAFFWGNEILEWYLNLLSINDFNL